MSQEVHKQRIYIYIHISSYINLLLVSSNLQAGCFCCVPGLKDHVWIPGRQANDHVGEHRPAMALDQCGKLWNILKAREH